MRRFLVLALCCAASASTMAQVPRPSSLVNANLSDDARGVGLASAGELTALVWNEGGGTNEVLVATSDGRGLTWSMPVRVDADSFAKTTQGDSVFVSGNSIYVVWEADSGLWFSRSLDSGATFEAPGPLDLGPGSVRDWRVAFSADPLGDHLYVASSTAVGDEDLYLTASHDGGSTFSDAVLVPSVGALGDVDGLGVAADGLTVHLAWDDGRSGSDTVYYQRSTDGGLSFLPSDVELGDNVGVEDSQDPVNIAIAGSTVAVAWNEEPDGSGDETIQVNVSVDGGLTFQGAVTVGDYEVGLDDTDEGDIGVSANGHVIVTWEDDRSAVDQAYVAVSMDGGLTFGPDVQLSLLGAQNPEIRTSGSGDYDLVFWESTTFPSLAQSSYSRDGGSTWSAPLTPSDNDGFVDFPTATYNELYQNFVHAWAALDVSTLKLYAGGYRPQTLTPIGTFVGGDPVRFDASNFPAGDAGLLFGVLISSAEGDFLLPAGDGRNSGLLQDALLAASVARIPGPLAGPIDETGAASTPEFPWPEALSGTIECTGISIDLGAPVEFSAITDRVTVTLPGNGQGSIPR